MNFLVSYVLVIQSKFIDVQIARRLPQCETKIYWFSEINASLFNQAW